jgi:hypothetical protein
VVGTALIPGQAPESVPPESRGDFFAGRRFALLGKSRKHRGFLRLRSGHETRQVRTRERQSELFDFVKL